MVKDTVFESIDMHFKLSNHVSVVNSSDALNLLEIRGKGRLEPSGKPRHLLVCIPFKSETSEVHQIGFMCSIGSPDHSSSMTAKECAENLTASSAGQ